MNSLNWKRCIIVCLAILATGAARLRIEEGLTQEMRAKGLLGEKLEVTTREKIGQTSAAVALGGLRTLVATFLNLRAMEEFHNQEWAKLDETYRLVVDLAPRTRYYWETASWHQSYNAAAYYQNASEMPAQRRREAWRLSITRGREILEQGIRNMPNDWSLQANLGFLLRDPNKISAFENPDEAMLAASRAYGMASRHKGALSYTRRFEFYTLAQVPGNEAEALALGRKLYAEGPVNRAPTLLCILFSLEAWERPEMDLVARAVELFGSREQAVEQLELYWQRVRERMPMHGVALALEKLYDALGVEREKRVIHQPPPRVFNPEDAFQEGFRRGD
jgi:hypothetical protein